jgi:mono/diheme cytochrome c family protein
MEPTRDNPLIRFAAFWWGIGVITLFFVVLVIVRLIVGGGGGKDPLEETARLNRLEISNQVDKAQAANLEWKTAEEGAETVQAKPDDIYGFIGSQLLATDPTKVDDPAQVVPGSAAAEVLANAPVETDYSEVDAMTPEAGTAPDAAVMEKGAQGYLLCAACHGADGKGVEASGMTIGPPIADSNWVKGPVSNLIRIQLRGLTGPITVSGKVYTPVAPMAAMGAASTDEDVAAVLTYIRNSFGNAAPPVLPEQVKALRSEIGKPMLTEADLLPAP